jgi:DNA-binding beta-propeller fold protein YncE
MTAAARPGFRRRRRIVWISAAALAVTVIVIAAVAAVNRFLGPPVIRVGQMPQALAVTPDGRTLYVAGPGGFRGDLFVHGHTVTPVSIATGVPGTPVRAGDQPQALAMTPDGRTLYVADSGGTVTPVTVATGRPGGAIRAGHGPQALAVTPDGRALYVADILGGTVAVISLKG